MSKETPVTETPVTETPVTDSSIDQAASVAGQELNQQKKVKIKLPKGEGNTLQDPQPVGINGYFWEIKRGEEVEVPIAVKHALENANLL